MIRRGSADTFSEPFTEARAQFRSFGRPQCRRTAYEGQDGQKPSVWRLSQLADFAGSRQPSADGQKEIVLDGRTPGSIHSDGWTAASSSDRFPTPPTRT